MVGLYFFADYIGDCDFRTSSLKKLKVFFIQQRSSMMGHISLGGGPI